MTRCPFLCAQVTKVGGVSSSNGPIQTVAGTAQNPVSNTANGAVPHSRPSDFGSELVQLDASQLPPEADDPARHAQKGTEQGGFPTGSHKKKVETPSNELSLEAELSAAFASRDENDDAVNLSLDEEIFATSTPKSDAAKEFPELPEKAEQEEKKEKPEPAEKVEDKDNAVDEATSETSETNKLDEVGSPSHKSEPQEIRQSTRDSTIILEDESIAESPVPDIVATSLVVKGESETPPDFMTSTPKKAEDTTTDDREDKSGMATDTSHYQSLSDNSHYETALTNQQSISSNDDSAEFSFLGEKKFAALLQTVPSFSYEGDDSEMMSSSFGSTSLDKSTDDMIVKSGSATPTAETSRSPETSIEKQQEQDQGSGSSDLNLNDSALTLQDNDNDSRLQEAPLMPPAETKAEETEKKE